MNVRQLVLWLAGLSVVMGQDDKAVKYGFDKDKAGAVPAGWSAGITGTKKSTPKWEILDADGEKVLGQLEKSGGGGDFPVCFVDKSSFKDGEISVRIKPISGKKDEAGGIAFRAKDKDNFYVVRANANEDNVSIYYTKDGKRIEIKYWKGIAVKLGEWHTLKVQAKGFTFKVWFDGKEVGEVEDKKKVFADVGQVGVWTKADSVTYFKELTVTSN